MTAVPSGLEIDQLRTVIASHQAHSADAAERKRPRAVLAGMLPILALLVLWSIHLLDAVFDLHLARYSLFPRRVEGLLGILTAPLLHSHSGPDPYQHLRDNSFAILLLGWGLLYFYPRIAGKVVLWSWLISGTGVWLMGRENYHLGASGVVYGMAVFLFVSGLLRKQRTLMALSLIVVFLYGSLVWGVLPIVPEISWESHLWGGVAGVLLAYRYRSVPPAVQDPLPITFSEDDEDEPTADGSSFPLPDGPLRVVRDTDPGDEVQDDERALERRQPHTFPQYDPRNTSTTGWVDDLFR